MLKSDRALLYYNIDSYGPDKYKSEKYIIITRLFYIANSEEYRSSVDFESELRYSHKRLPWVFTGESTLEYLKTLIIMIAYHVGCDVADLEPGRSSFYYRCGWIDKELRRAFPPEQIR
jgi:hypothetical protein